MRSLLLPIVSLGVSLVSQTATGNSAQTSVRLKGYLGERLDAMIRRDVEQTDLAYVCEPFQFRTERQNGWQTEFWGKYMHSAVPYSRYQESSSLWNALEDSVSRVVATQEEDGYIGNYPQELR